LEPVLEANQISRRYGDFLALKPTSFSLNPGELVTISGPNGAGKSTLLLCLSGLLGLSTGSIQVGGHDLYAEEPGARRAMAYVPDVPVFYNELTAWEHLYFMDLAHNAVHKGDGRVEQHRQGFNKETFEKRAEWLLRDFGLWEARNLFPHAYSRGMRLKLGLALALIRPFQVLVLDEPTSALDQESIAILVKKLDDQRRDGAAVLLSTHDPALSGQLGAKNWRMVDGEIIF
jgi:ABC-2 type transport system ATP-binding protein